MPKDSKTTDVGRYKKLVSALQELGSILNTEQLVERIVITAADLCDAEAACILTPNQINQSLDYYIGSFTDDSQFHRLSTPLNSSLEGWVFCNQNPVLINETNIYDQKFGEYIYLPGVEINSLLVVPLTIKGNRIGILEVVNKRKGEFTNLDQEILVAFECQAAIYIDNTHRFLQSDLVTELVHELHTPMAALNTALYLLQRTDLPDNRREQISQMVHNEFSRLSELTTSFLDYARMESGRMKFKLIQFNMAELIQESVDIIQIQPDGKGMKISLDIPTQPLVVSADKDKMKQVILNLLSNAIKYNHPGGIINISASSTQNEIKFSVQDSGPGIPPEYLPRLFERFYRVPNIEKGTKGTGLGLTICKQIVEAHNGKIEVSSTVGQGSTFTVHLPLKQED